MKWGFIPKDAPVKYLAVNTDEGEPGTFKDRLIVERDPHSILEGVIIAAYAIGAHRAFVYIRGEFFLGVKRWIKAISDAYEHGFLGKNILGSGFDLDVSVHRGAGAYICGEETAMIESLEGDRGRAPAEAALPGAEGPVAAADPRAERRDAWRTSRTSSAGAQPGTPASAPSRARDPKIFCVSGHVNRPGNYELPLGVTLREIIEEHAGGVRLGRNVKAVIPGGASTPILTGDKLDVPMAFETLASGRFGAGHGRGDRDGRNDGYGGGCAPHHVTSSSTSPAAAARPAGSAGGGCSKRCNTIASGKAAAGDLVKLEELAAGISGVTFCPMGTGMCEPVSSGL